MKNNNQEKSLTDILTNTNTNVGDAERVVSAVGGGALLAYGLKRGDALGIALAVLGGGLALRGATGHCQVYDVMDVDRSDSERGNATYSKGRSGKIHVKKSITINKSTSELYNFWRDFENLPQFMNHLESVKNIDNKRSHWVAKAPLGTTVEWDAEITSEHENERIGWRSVENSEIPNSGVVEFLPTSTRGTEVKVTLTYEPPAGYLGSLVAKLFGEEPSQQVEEDLRRFKSLMEAGMIMKVEGQPSGRAPQAKEASA
jgi:uncharacterized membrane protein